LPEKDKHNTIRWMHHLLEALIEVGGGRFNELRGDKRGMQRAGGSVGQRGG